MTTEDNCTYRGWPDHPSDKDCDRFCILHYDSADKDATLFQARLEARIRHDESDPSVKVIDLSGVVFPPGDANFVGKVFTKNVSFWGAQFRGGANFRDAQFPGEAYFGGAQFTGGAYFLDAQFTGEADFGGAQFRDVANFLRAEFRGGAYFRGTEFRGEASFGDAQFRGVANFLGAQFHGGADFRGAQFTGDARFEDAQFHGGAYFRGAQFHGGAYFGYAQFHGEAYFGDAQFTGKAYFGDAKFPKGADFEQAVVGKTLEFRDTSFPEADSNATVKLTNLRLSNLQGLDFENVNLSRVSFRGTDVSQARFLSCKWAEMPLTLLWPIRLPAWADRLMQRLLTKTERLRQWLPARLRWLLPLWLIRSRRWRDAIYDELTLSAPGKTATEVQEQIPLVADVYRHLRINYEANRQEVEAGAFYVGQMEMRRVNAELSWHYRLLLNVYRGIAMYGESYARPLLLYFAVAFMMALFYLLGGLEVNGKPVDYALSVHLGNAGNFFRDYARGLYYALTAGALLRGEITTLSWWVPLVQYVNMLVNILFITVFVVAIRRRFHR